MSYYTYNQNNSGGTFEFDEKSGITHFVVIEANSADEANRRAEEIGIYFDGCSSGMDCSCCGDRWYEAYRDEGTKVPEVYGQDIRSNGHVALYGSWMEEGKEVSVHPNEGDIEWYGAVKDEM